MSRPVHPAAARMRVSARERVTGRDRAEPDRSRTGLCIAPATSASGTSETVH